MEHDVLRLQVGMNDVAVSEDCQSIQNLAHDDPDEVQGEASELVLLDDVEQAHSKQVKRQAKMTPPSEAVADANDMIAGQGITLEK